MSEKFEFIARYRKKDVNPFKQKFGSGDIKTIKVQLTPEQAEKKDELAEEATPKGYEFIECEMV